MCTGPVVFIALVPDISIHQLGSIVVTTFISPTASVDEPRKATSMQWVSPDVQLGSPISVDSRLSSTMVSVPGAPRAPGFDVVKG